MPYPKAPVFLCLLLLWLDSANAKIKQPDKKSADFLACLKDTSTGKDVKQSILACVLEYGSVKEIMNPDTHTGDSSSSDGSSDDSSSSEQERVCELQITKQNQLPLILTSNSEPKLEGVSHCGLTNTNDEEKKQLQIGDLNERIVGGEESDVNQWPWLASIMFKSYTGWCGASLINDHWAITAAHCILERINPCDYKVALGEHDFTEDDTDRKDIPIKKAITHKYWNSVMTSSFPYFFNDIALIQLEGPVNSTQHSHITPICLPEPDEDFSNLECITAGWGAVEEGSYGSDHVRHVQVKIWTPDDCKKYLGRSYLDGYICAGYEKGGKDACKGDSGGPLMCKVDNKWKLVGITSWGIGCGRPGMPGIYTNVAYHMDWILPTVVKNS